jgi:hypothetical protein
MVSTVTTSTVTTISTITAMGLVTAVGLAGTLTLICLLMTRELAGVQTSSKYKMLAKFSDVGIIPLTLAFGVTVILKVVEVLT